jgi:hypothetical protein
MAYVEQTAPAYRTWSANGYFPTVIASPADLFLVLLQDIQPRIMAQGVTLQCYGSPHLAGTYTLNDQATNLIGNINGNIVAGRPLPGGGTTFNFTDAKGVQYSFTALQFENFATACANYAYSWQQALITNLNGGNTLYPSTAITIP